MAIDIEELKEAVKASVKVSVKDAFEDYLDEGYKKKVKEEEESDEDESSDDDEEDGSDDDEDEDVKESEDKEKSTGYQKFFKKALKKFGVKSPDELDDKKEKEFYDYVDANWESDSEEENDDEVEEGNSKAKKLKESISVDAMKAGGRGKSDIETMNISRMGELVKLANSRKYEYFTVRKRNGQEIEYHVDFSGGKPKLVEM